MVLMRCIFGRFEFVIRQYNCGIFTCSLSSTVTRLQPRINHAYDCLSRTHYDCIVANATAPKSIRYLTSNGLLWGPKLAGVWRRTLPVPNKVMLPSGTMHTCRVASACTTILLLGGGAAVVNCPVSRATDHVSKYK